MPRRARTTVSSRSLVERFAAHLAHLLNTGEEVVSLSPFGLYRTLIRTLSGQSGAVGSARYRNGLVGFSIVAGERSAEEAAEKYFEAVLNRPLHLARDGAFHRGHVLFLALCRRGLDRHWQEAQLMRRREQPELRPTKSPNDFGGVRARLARLDQTISQSNPANTTRARQGPLGLQAGGAWTEIAEEMSVWGGISSAPLRLKPLAQGAEFNAFCSAVIKAVEAANAPYGAILSLGLSPFDWAEVLSVNTAKKVSSFLSAVHRQAENEEGRQDELETWRQVWEERKVPGFDSADDLWNSEIGRALRMPQTARRLEIIEMDSIGDDSQDAARDAELLNERDFNGRICLAQASGEIDEFEAWLLNEVFNGGDLDDLAGTAKVRARCPGGADELATYVEDLGARLLSWAIRMDAGGMHPDKREEPLGRGADR